MAIISLENISFNYSQRDSLVKFALDGLNISVKKGDFISILGPNGSGKSTLLKLMANILTPEKGERKLLNRDYSEIERKEFARYIAFVPQNSGTNFTYSIYEIVMMGRSPYLNFLGVEKSFDHKLVIETLDLLEISHLKNKGINEVSGGEAQRALIARALVQQPEILLLDEPNAHLDIKHQLSIYNLLRELNKNEELTIVSISHDLNFSNYYSSRGILMRDGKILYDSVPDEILTKVNIKEVFDVEAQILLNESSKNKFISLIT